MSNYSVNLVGFGQIIFNSSTPSSGRRISAKLTSSLVSGLVPDLMYAISVTACNEISCHESEAREVCELISWCVFMCSLVSFMASLMFMSLQLRLANSYIVVILYS